MDPNPGAITTVSQLGSYTGAKRRVIPPGALKQTLSGLKLQKSANLGTFFRTIFLQIQVFEWEGLIACLAFSEGGKLGLRMVVTNE